MGNFFLSNIKGLLYRYVQKKLVTKLNTGIFALKKILYMFKQIGPDPGPYHKIAGTVLAGFKKNIYIKPVLLCILLFVTCWDLLKGLFSENQEGRSINSL
jgi:hypothetical protein